MCAFENNNFIQNVLKEEENDGWPVTLFYSLYNRAE